MNMLQCVAHQHIYIVIKQKQLGFNITTSTQMEKHVFLYIFRVVPQLKRGNSVQKTSLSF